MSKLNYYVEQLIKRYIEYIDEQRFSEIYVDMWYKHDEGQLKPEWIGKFTKALLDADIDPLKLLNHIPFCYLYGVHDLDKFNPPVNIRHVEPKAFTDSLVKSIDGKFITRIEREAFYQCRYLHELILSPALGFIGPNAFNMCHSLKTITFLGTKDEWDTIYKSIQWDVGSVIEEIHCVDGVLYLE